MARAFALDLSDGGLVGLGEDGVVLGPSPGVALVAGGPPLFGDAARRRSRLSPRLVASDCWARLDTVPLGPPFPEGLSRADLVHGHLESLWKAARRGTTEVVLAVPGVRGEESLGLLLGIAESLGMPVAGLADAALAAAAAGFPGEHLLHVDVGLRHAAVTEIRQGRELVRERVATIDRWGQDEIEDALMRGAAAAFVRESRFDPLHDAATEQALFDRLPDWLAALAKGGRAVLSLPVAGRDAPSIELRPEEAEAWTAAYASELSQQVSLLKRTGEPTTVLVSAHAARLPGLVSRIAAIRGVEVALLPVQAAAAGALRERAAVRSPAGARRFVTRLPRAEGREGTVGGDALLLPPRAAAVPAAGRGRRPTHVLLGSEARAITPEPLVLGTAPPEGARALRLAGDTAGVSRAHCRLVESGGTVLLEDLSTWGTFVNGERVPGRAVVEAGDRIRVGSPGIELLLVAVTEG